MDENSIRYYLHNGFMRVIHRVMDEESNKKKSIWDIEELLQEDVVDYGQVTYEE